MPVGVPYAVKAAKKDLRRVLQECRDSLGWYDRVRMIHFSGS